IALSPDESVLYVANSDPEQAMWVAYDLSPEGTVSGKRVFADATASVGQENPGLPDGLKVDTEGRLFATGPGGVWVLDKSGAHLGTIRTDGATANVAFGEDGSTLFLTSNQYLARINTRTKGLGF
ncbi:MAG: SMP-30/gluconolactonase/LRE family protein, partial [Rhodothermales bacterium]|nr:SMP-30/gluconolactonase/LRE family protein [Rhodothermales bacterium]